MKTLIIILALTTISAVAVGLAALYWLTDKFTWAGKD